MCTNFLVEITRMELNEINDRIRETPTEVLERYVEFVENILYEMNPIKRMCYSVGIDSYRYSIAKEELQKRSS